MSRNALVGATLTKNKVLGIGLFIASIGGGYAYSAMFGIKQAYWLIAGLICSIVVLKLVQIILFRHVKTAEARMSPEERRGFEDFKRRVSGEGDGA